MGANLADADAIFCAAIELPTEESRREYLAGACGEDIGLRSAVDALLAAHFEAGSFLELPPATLIYTAADDVTETVGTLIGPYKLLQQIGEGGMGVVFLAEQLRPIQRKVALKIIKPGMDTRQVIARFEAERQALALMDHPNIARVLDAGKTDSGRPYFVMELVKGTPITRFCDERQLPLCARLELFVQVCQAVQHAHQKGIIHRDIKPNNVLVAEYDGKPVPKVIDFGVAKAVAQRLTERTMFTEYGQIIGTFEYMSPEQALFNQLDVDTRSDVYSLGVLLYELIAGSTPLEHDRLRAAAFNEILRIIGEEEPPRPSTRLSSSESLPSIAANRSLEPTSLKGLISGELDWIVMKCLTKERNARFSSAAELATDIEHWLRDEPISVRAPDPAYLLRIWLKRNFGSRGWAIALGVIWGIAAGIINWLVMLNPLDMPLGLRRAIYLLCIGLLGSVGLINVWLIRPKNATADFVSGALTGGVAAILCHTISWAWVAVLIAGVPYGIWVSMVSAVVFMGSICLFGTLAAGRLLRQKGELRATIWPYAELAAPSMLALVFWNAIAFNLSTARWADWQYFLAGAVLCSLAAVAVFSRLHWMWRALFHAAWLTGLYVFITRPMS